MGHVAIMAIIRFNMTSEAAPISGAMAMVSWFLYAITFALSPGIMIVRLVAIMAII